MEDMAASDVATSARRRRDRHVRTTVAMELATALHHSAQRPKSRVVEGPSEGEVRETYDALRRLKAPLPGLRLGLPPEPEPLERAVTDGPRGCPSASPGGGVAGWRRRC